MTSSELRRLLTDLSHWPTAIYTLANHADVLVRLVDACETLRLTTLPPMDAKQAKAIRAVHDAVAAVHAIKEQP